MSIKFLKRFFKKRPKVERVNITRRFDLISRVGQGSMSRVWRAKDAMSGRIVALKVLDLNKTRRYESRFAGLGKPSEGTVAAGLKHPNIVRTFECGITTKDEPFLVMEFVQGVGLSYLVDTQNDVMQENRLRFIVQVGEAVDYLHRQNWIHRDICPRNILLDQDHTVKLIDFGLVVPNTEPFQKPGNRTGTASYMAPELIKRQRTDQRIDLFSYAVSCYEMYTRRFPWRSEGITLETAMEHINRPPVDIRELVPGIDDQVAATIMKGLEADPDKRWQTAREMVHEFRQALKRQDADAPEVDADQAATGKAGTPDEAASPGE